MIGVNIKDIDCGNNYLCNFSLDELTARQSRRFAKIDQNSNGLIDKDEFNARLVAMFTRMDRNGDGLLRDDELPR